MAAKFIVCAIAIIIQMISAQVISNAYNSGLLANGFSSEAAALATYGPALGPNGPYGPGLGPNIPYGPGLPYPTANPLAYEAPSPACGFGLSLSGLAANGGGFAVTSSSPIAPSGVTVQSENLVFEGPLVVSGQMPFLGAVALEGPLAAAGQGAVAYGCGNGNIGIVAEDLAVNGLAGPLGPGGPGLGYNGVGPYGPVY